MVLFVGGLISCTNKPLYKMLQVIVVFMYINFTHSRFFCSRTWFIRKSYPDFIV